ncbi:hypothetical protein OROMI_028221 [Orobanche minor]
MGAACCVAAKDRTILSVSHGETMQRDVRHSPSWNFRWDNRGRVVGEETTATWLCDGGGGHDEVEVKSGTTLETAFASEEGSLVDSFRSSQSQKSPVSEGTAGFADQAISRNIVEVKAITDSSPIKLSPSVPSVSSLSTSPLSSQSQLLPPKSTPSRWHHLSPGRHLIAQTSSARMPEYKSPTLSISEEPSLSLPPSWGNESTRASDGGGSSDSWSIPFSSNLMTQRRERWSFDSENSVLFGRERITRSIRRNSRSPSIDLRTCGVCMKLLTERSSWGCKSQKIISTNELAVISVLTCGHVYHAECLEHMTSEINKYDPACPVCTFGEKRAAKMSEKALRAEMMNLKARKRSRKRVVDSGTSSDIVFEHPKHSGIEESGLKISLDGRSSLEKPFLRRHFSFGSKSSSKLLSGNQSARRKSFFWAKSSKD